MTRTRQGVAATSARPRVADRDEYPVLGAFAHVAPNTGLVMGPPPRVHLGSCSVPGVAPMQPASVVAKAAEAVRAEASRWKPVDPQTARAVLRVEREVEIPASRHRTRRPRPPQLSSGDATERLRRLVTIDRRRRAIMIATSVLGVVGLLGAIWHFTSVGYAADQPATTWNQVALSDPAAGTRAASHAVSASATPSVTPSTTQAAPPTDATTTVRPTQTAKTSQVPAALRANAIYGATIARSCPEQEKPTTAEDARAALTAYVDCMNDVWGPIIDAGKIRFKPASIYFYVNTTVNPCTTLHTSDPVTAMYCPRDATIYVSPNGVASVVGSRLYGAELVTHEYAHHVQSLSQILTVAQKQGWSDNEYSRRIQLQAVCMSFAVLDHVDGFAPDPAAFRASWQAGPGSDTYGSIASIQYWGEKGLAATTVGACDTFSVPSSVVA